MKYNLQIYHTIMPKSNKVYEYDYEWTGQENESKGVNIKEKNPWNKPDWGSGPTKPNHSTSQSSYVQQPDRFGIEELQRKHKWEKPDWATVQKKTDKNGGATTSQSSKHEDAAIIKDSIPKPMLKMTPAGIIAGIDGASSPSTILGQKLKNGNTAAVKNDDIENEIAEMERRIEEAKRKKSQLVAMKQNEGTEQVSNEVVAENEREKYKVDDESKLERAKRLAKEREDARWRATLAERNKRDAEKREQARLAALSKNNASSSSVISSDSKWEKTQQEQQVRYENRVQQEAMKRKVLEETEMNTVKGNNQILISANNTMIHTPNHHHLVTTDTGSSVGAVEKFNNIANEVDIQEGEYVEEYEVEEYTEEYEEEEEEVVEGEIQEVEQQKSQASSSIDEIQRQIDELRKKLLASSSS